MTTISISKICPQIIKGYNKILRYKNPRIDLSLSTSHLKLVKDGHIDLQRPQMFHMPQYETVENDTNILTMTITNYDANTDTNVQFDNENVIIDIVSNNKNFIQKEGSACFVYHSQQKYINIAKHRYIILNPVNIECDDNNN